MKLIFLHGRPAVGKLTVARELATLTGFRLFHNHLAVDLAIALFPFGSESFVQLRETIWRAAFSEAARTDVSLIFTFSPERTVRTSFIQETIDIVEGAGGEIIFVELICDELELERRLEMETRRKYGKLASLEQFRTLKNEGAFEFPPLPRLLTVDTSMQAPRTTAQVIAQAIADRNSSESKL